MRRRATRVPLRAQSHCVVSRVISMTPSLVFADDHAAVPCVERVLRSHAIPPWKTQHGSDNG